MRGGDPMPPELAKGKWLMPWDSKSLVQQIELGEDSRVEFEEAGFAGNRVRAPRRETVSSAGGPLAGAQVVALYPNKTWMEGTTDTFGRVTLGSTRSFPSPSSAPRQGMAAMWSGIGGRRNPSPCSSTPCRGAAR